MFLFIRWFKRFFICTLLFFIIINIAHAGDRRDGNYWRALNKSQKSIYVLGFFDGMGLGYNFSYWGFYLSNNDKSSKLSQKVADSYNKFTTKYFQSVTNIQLVDGLNIFYEDYRNRRIIIRNSVWLVVQSIAGTPKAEMDKMTEKWRQNAITE